MILYQQRGNRLYFIVISCLIFNMAGSPPVVHLRYYAHSNGISPTMPASPPPYPMHLFLPSPGHTTTPFGGESSIIHMDMGRLCWIWLILGWRYHYDDIYVTRASTKYQR